MSWKVEYKKRFLKELSKLPIKIQIRVEVIVFEELTKSYPFSLGIIEMMVGYPNKYKIRIGSYRNRNNYRKIQKINNLSTHCPSKRDLQNIYMIFKSLKIS